MWTWFQSCRSRDKVEKSEFSQCHSWGQWQNHGQNPDLLRTNIINCPLKLKSILPYHGIISQTLFLRLLVYQARTRMTFLLFIITQSIFHAGTKHKILMLNFTSQNQTFLQELCYHLFFFFFTMRLDPSEFPFKDHLKHCLIMKNWK